MSEEWRYRLELLSRRHLSLPRFGVAEAVCLSIPLARLTRVFAIAADFPPPARLTRSHSRCSPLGGRAGGFVLLRRVLRRLECVEHDFRCGVSVQRLKAGPRNSPRTKVNPVNRGRWRTLTTWLSSGVHLDDRSMWSVRS